MKVFNKLVGKKIKKIVFYEGYPKPYESEKGLWTSAVEMIVMEDGEQLTAGDAFGFPTIEIFAGYKTEKNVGGRKANRLLV